MIFLIGLLLGSLPGVHPNLLALLNLPRESLFELVFASLFSSIIPALLFVPAPDLAISLLPGQEMVKKGKMGRAVIEFAAGALAGAVLFALLAPIYPFLAGLALRARKYTFLALLAFLLPLFIRERNRAKALLVFLLSGLYGLFILRSGIEGNKLLLVHFSAMFGLAGILNSSKPPEQEVNIGNWRFDPFSALLGTLGGLLISLFPALTQAQVAAFLYLIFREPENQLNASGAISTSSFLFSFLSLRYLGKGRMGAVEKIGILNLNFLLIAIFSFISLYLLAPLLAKLSTKAFEHRRIIALALLANSLYFGREAFIFFLPSLLLGFLPYRLGVNRVHLMGSLALPTLIWYFGKLK